MNLKVVEMTRREFDDSVLFSEGLFTAYGMIGRCPLQLDDWRNVCTFPELSVSPVVGNEFGNYLSLFSFHESMNIVATESPQDMFTLVAFGLNRERVMAQTDTIRNRVEFYPEHPPEQFINVLERDVYNYHVIYRTALEQAGALNASVGRVFGLLQYTSILQRYHRVPLEDALPLAAQKFQVRFPEAAS